DSASRRLSVFRSNGLCGATHGAKRAAARQTTSTTAETIATGECRKEKAMSLFHAAERRTGSTGSVALSVIVNWGMSLSTGYAIRLLRGFPDRPLGASRAPFASRLTRSRDPPTA